MTQVLESKVNDDIVTRTSGTGFDLVLIHGWGMNSGAFSEFIPLLEADFRVTTIDLPGFGENHITVPHPYSVATLAKAMSPYLPERCAVVGWSLGGLVAQQLALHSPENVEAVVTIASTPKFVAGPGWPGIAPDLLNQFEQQLEQDFSRTLERFLAIQAMGSETARKDVKTIRQHITRYPSPSSTALREGLTLLSTEDMRKEIGRITQPTLRLYGRLDSLVPTSGIDMICQLHPQADTVVLPHAAHAPFISHPVQSADVIRHFLHTQVLMKINEASSAG